MRKVIKVLLIILCCSSCHSGGRLRPTDYVKFLDNPDNQFISKQVFGDKEYSIQLATAEYMLAHELEASDSSALYAQRLKELKGFVFFLIKMGATAESRKQQGGNRVSEQQLKVDDMVAYYDQQAIMDISLMSGEKELKPSTYVFENNYDLSPYNTIVIGFEVGELNQDLTLNFNDRYTQTPAIRASYSKEQLSSLPKLNINN
jgi:hypothetical protein